jgi:UDP-N-acetylmuramate--alanine ligase
LVAQADVKADDIKQDGFSTEFSVFIKNELMGKVNINMPGIHNVYNALAAITVAWELEIPFNVIQESLNRFGGVNRRFYVKGKAGDSLIIDDYAHHPVEIKATLNAAKGFNKRIIAVFQPHRYSRTKELLEQFATAFYNADKLIVTDIYAASETPIEGVDARSVYEKIKEYGHKDVHYISEFEDIAEFLSKIVEDDLVITLGAGDVWKVGEKLMKKIKG